MIAKVYVGMSFLNLLVVIIIIATTNVLLTWQGIVLMIGLALLSLALAVRAKWEHKWNLKKGR